MSNDILNCFRTILEIDLLFHIKRSSLIEYSHTKSHLPCVRVVLAAYLSLYLIHKTLLELKGVMMAAYLLYLIHYMDHKHLSTAYSFKTLLNIILVGFE